MLIGKHSPVSPIQEDIVKKFHKSTDYSGIHSNIIRNSTYEHSSNFKCINYNDIDEIVEFMFDNVIEVNNMLDNFNYVPSFVPKANQGPLQFAPTAAGLCLCTGKCRFNYINGLHAGNYGFIPLQPLGRFRNNSNPSQVGDNNYVHLHNRLVNRETPNCAGPQFKIQTDLNIHLLESSIVKS